MGHVNVADPVIECVYDIIQDGICTLYKEILFALVLFYVIMWICPGEQGLLVYVVALAMWRYLYVQYNKKVTD